MSILNANQIREMDGDELNERLVELRGDLMKIRGTIASGGSPEDVGKTREIRRTIARMLTIKQEKTKKTKKI
ncbi:MAG: 50S ribosomal protein L29 [Candidatus Altiarchaeales archaeon HGW-Altiarchaeales-3]|nr:MAG: 50S ribosomal protein L29 [Candidatus Altiarchaeales archaeon HGW-Altiarchaeales-3]